MKLRIQNFQAHKDTTIEFDRITTIVGPSDTGKSAVLRAFKWVEKNELSLKKALEEFQAAYGDKLGGEK